MATLLQAVKDDLAALVNDNVNMHRLYGIAEEKANQVHTNTKKGLVRIDKELAEMDKRFDKLLSLHVDDKITSDQFMQQNEEQYSNNKNYRIEKLN